MAELEILGKLERLKQEVGCNAFHELQARFRNFSFRVSCETATRTYHVWQNLARHHISWYDFGKQIDRNLLWSVSTKPQDWTDMGTHALACQRIDETARQEVNGRQNYRDEQGIDWNASVVDLNSISSVSSFARVGCAKARPTSMETMAITIVTTRTAKYHLHRRSSQLSNDLGWRATHHDGTSGYCFISFMWISSGSEYVCRMALHILGP